MPKKGYKQTQKHRRKIGKSVKKYRKKKDVNCSKTRKKLRKIIHANKRKRKLKYFIKKLKNTRRMIKKWKRKYRRMKLKRKYYVKKPKLTKFEKYVLKQREKGSDLSDIIEHFNYLIEIFCNASFINNSEVFDYDDLRQALKDLRSNELKIKLKKGWSSKLQPFFF